MAGKYTIPAFLVFLGRKDAIVKVGDRRTKSGSIRFDSITKESSRESKKKLDDDDDHRRL